jgi:hypothetical protein
MWRSAALMGLLMLTACNADRGRITAADNETCAGYGFKPGTDAFANCRMRLETQRADHQEAAARYPQLNPRCTSAGPEHSAGIPPLGASPNARIGRLRA